MNRARHIMRLMEEQSIVASTWGVTNIRPLPKNRGLMFRVSGNRFSGLIKVKYGQSDIYDILYIPNCKGEVKLQKGVCEVELVNVISKEIGLSSMALDFWIDMFLYLNK
jgi:hypothetical protein